MYYFRRKLKTASNYVPFSFDNKRSQKYFVEPSNVKEELDKLFNLWELLDDESPSSILAKYVIMQIELIAIYTFIDGNGRVSRVLSESYLESYDFIPYTPYSTDYKKEYQNMMEKYSIEELDDLKIAYGIIADYFLNE